MQSAFDPSIGAGTAGASSHSLKMPSSLSGKYGGHPSYSDLANLENETLSDISSPSQVIVQPAYKHLFSQSHNSNTNNLEENHKAKNKNPREEQDIPKQDWCNEHEKYKNSPSPQCQDEADDTISKARFVAAQQIFLQQLQKRRQLLMSAAQTQDSSHSDNNGGKLFHHFPFNIPPINAPPIATIPSIFPNGFDSHKVDNGVLINGKIHQNQDEERGELLQQMYQLPAAGGQLENMIMLFTQIQNYRRHLLESGTMKFPSMVESHHVDPIIPTAKPYEHGL